MRLGGSHSCLQSAETGQAVRWDGRGTGPVLLIMQRDSPGLFTSWRLQEKIGPMHRTFSGLCLCYICFGPLAKSNLLAHPRWDGWRNGLHLLLRREESVAISCDL